MSQIYHHSDILAAVALPTLLVDAAGRVETHNPAITDILGDGIEGRHYITVLRQPMLLDAVDGCLRSGAPGSAKYLGRSHTGDTTFDVQVNPVRVQGGFASVLTFIDVSAVQHMTQMRRDFVANVSHELRTPLTAISGFIDTLAGPAQDDKIASARFLNLMRLEADRMNHLIRDLLSLSRVEAEQRVRPSDAVDLREVIGAVVRRMSVVAKGAGVMLEQAEASDRIPILADADQLVQVFSNLVENAIKYGPEAGGTVTLRVSETTYEATLRGPGVRIDVIDQGDGIDALHLPRLTERFYRVDSHRSRALGGTGLGLAIVKHILNRHRGRLRIKSEMGVGSTFSVILPRHVE